MRGFDILQLILGFLVVGVGANESRIHLPCLHRGSNACLGGIVEQKELGSSIDCPRWINP